MPRKSEQIRRLESINEEQSTRIQEMLSHNQKLGNRHHFLKMAYKKLSEANLLFVQSNSVD